MFHISCNAWFNASLHLARDGLYSNASRQRMVSSGRHKTSACPAEHADTPPPGATGSKRFTLKERDKNG
jgi:hypothetical protein